MTVEIPSIWIGVFVIVIILCLRAVRARTLADPLPSGEHRCLRCGYIGFEGVMADV